MRFPRAIARGRPVVVLILAVLSGRTPVDAGAAADGCWPAPVPGWEPVQPGEHPRLFFRKPDLPALRARAETPEGKAILARLRRLLNGGDGRTMPSSKRPVEAAFGDKSPELDLPEGTYSIGHAAGYGLLYQLTGEQQYADLGRQCFEWAFAGVRDRDGKGRYSWKAPSGALRAGPSVGWYAAGYDLCYDGWDDACRRKIAQAIQDYGRGEKDVSLEDLARGRRQHPGSNHWGAIVGGASLALLAIAGDPGVDAQRIEGLLKDNEACILRQLANGWGDHGFYVEGDGCGAISSDTALVPALQAWRVAAGKDFITPRPNAPWMTLKWVMLSLPAKDGAAFPGRGVYGHNLWARRQLSGSGQFAQGFGAIGDAEKPALLWLYNAAFRDADEKAGAPFDTVSPYPHRAVLAFVNWPMGAAERNPGEVLPRAVRDEAMGFCMFRNRWQDGDDIVVTTLLKSTKGNYGVPGGDIIVWGLGRRTRFPVKMTGAVTHFEATATGGVVSTSAGSFGVDFSKASGAEALMVLAGPVQGGVKAGSGVQVIEAAGTNYVLMTLQRGEAPAAKAEGGQVAIGGQTVAYDGKKVTFAK